MNGPSPSKILFDTDPGGDDVFALLWLQSLARQGRAEIAAVTTVGGNVSARQTFLNASAALALGGFEHVELGRGEQVSPGTVDAAYIHGRDGIGNLSDSLPPPPHRWESAPPSPELIIEQLKSDPGRITLVAVGPLTNLAAAEKKEPGILGQAQEVVVMGGALSRPGNITSEAEFNVFCDPEAARKVITSRDDVVMLPLDVTTKINFQQQHAESVLSAAPEHPIACFLAALSEFLIETTSSFRKEKGPECFHVHDAATLAYLFYPQLFLFQRGRVCIESSASASRGKTTFDHGGSKEARANAWVAQRVEAAQLLSILVGDLQLLCTRD